MTQIFLSASVPLPGCDPKYAETADVIAIREAVKALICEAIPAATVIFGHYPAITPLVALLLRPFRSYQESKVIMYQSAYYANEFPREVSEFIDLRLVPAAGNSKEQSDAAMRERMINDHRFDAGVFIGGMEGVEEEYHLFCHAHKNAAIWPVASTGAAAARIYESLGQPRPDLFLNGLAYATLFRKLTRELSRK